MSSVGVFYGRMNPFTRGHKAAVNFIRSTGRTPIIVISHSFNTTTNPLTVNEKREAIREMVGKNIEILSTSKNKPHIHMILNNLKKRGIENIEVFLGSNRIPQFGYLTKYGVKLTPFGNKRNESNSGLAGVSGRKARTAAVSGNKKAFQSMMPNTLSVATANKLMRLIQNRTTPAPSPAKRRRKS